MTDNEKINIWDILMIATFLHSKTIIIFNQIIIGIITT